MIRRDLAACWSVSVGGRADTLMVGNFWSGAMGGHSHSLDPIVRGVLESRAGEILGPPRESG